jgi:hypothetical protein
MASPQRSNKRERTAAPRFQGISAILALAQVVPCTAKRQLEAARVFAEEKAATRPEGACAFSDCPGLAQLKAQCAYPPLDIPTCEVDGLTYHAWRCKPIQWSLHDLFSKWGFEWTARTAPMTTSLAVIRLAGYEWTTEQWGTHGCPIKDIYRACDHSRVYPPDGYKSGGYDEVSVLAVLPLNLVAALDEWQNSQMFAAMGGKVVQMPDNVFHLRTFSADEEDPSEDDESSAEEY